MPRKRIQPKRSFRGCAREKCRWRRDMLRNELLYGEIFYPLREAQVVIEHGRQRHNAIRPHSSLCYRPPAPEVIVQPINQAVALRPQQNQHRMWLRQRGPAKSGNLPFAPVWAFKAGLTA